MRKTGNIAVTPTITTTSTAYGYERSPSENVSVERKIYHIKEGQVL